MANKKRSKIGIVIVAHDSPNQLAMLLESIRPQINRGDEIIIVDNHFKFQSAEAAKTFDFITKIVKTENKGFAVACNAGAKLLNNNIELIFFINPDTVLDTNCLKEITNNIPKDWAAWMGLLIKQDGKVNSAGNAVHMSGLSWCDGFDASISKFDEKKIITFLSGACLMIRKEIYNKIGGVPEDYFLYYEDTALSTILLLENYKVGLVPNAKIYHEYEYIKGKNKWFFLERNRYLYILICWPSILILLLLPYLFIVELGLWIVSFLQRRASTRLHALMSLINNLPRIVKQRKILINKVNINTYDFTEKLTAEINTKQLNYSKSFFLFNKLSIIYLFFTKKLIRIFSSQ